MTKIGKRSLAVLAAGAMLLTSFNMPFAETESKAAGYGISSPRIEKDVLISGDDSEKPEGTISNPVVKADVTTWDCITFGNYWQEDTNGDGKVDQTDKKQPIKWRVLSVDGDDAFLLADQNLDCQPYNTDDTAVTWENCSLRKWLNQDFMNAAFTEEEQNAILETEVVNENYNTAQGKMEQETTTKDRIYLLSTNDVLYNIIEQGAKNTGYAKDCGAYTSKIIGHEQEGNWWFRDTINNRGRIYSPGWGKVADASNMNTCAVRPVIHLSLNSGGWKKVEVKKDIGRFRSSWSCITFGNYWQEDTNGDGKVDQTDEKQPIKWRVLSVDADNMFLMADKNLDCHPYNTEEKGVTWEECSLRKWLNEQFINNAFSQEEQSIIQQTEVVNEDNLEYETKGGSVTKDNIYLLSMREVSEKSYGFDSGFTIQNATREADNTGYAKNNGVYILTGTGEGNGCWWLRSPGISSEYISGKRYAAYIQSSGSGFTEGTNENFPINGIRPVLNISRSSSLWKSAGKVKSYKEESAPTPSPISTPTMQPTVSPSATTTMKPQPANTPANTGKQTPQSPQQQPTPQAGSNTGTTADNAAKVSLIKQSKVSWKTAKNTKGRKLTANWKKASNADGYQIQYAPNKKFKKAKRKTVKSTSVTIKKLKKKTTYFVRVRAYKAVDGKKVYGKWSSVKKVKIKK